MSKSLIRTILYTRSKLPHWEVEGGRYFVTVRCADSLPTEVVARLSEVQLSFATIAPGSDDFAALQRQYFATIEKYLDSGAGSCPLAKPEVTRLITNELEALAADDIQVPHYTVLPNHWHALIQPGPSAGLGLNEIMKRVKGRTGKAIRRLIGGAGPIWQREWFDRWMRNDTEWERCVAYVRNNPVKAGLVERWQDHHATK